MQRVAINTSTLSHATKWYDNRHRFFSDREGKRNMKGILSVSLVLFAALTALGQEISVFSQQDPDTNFGTYTTYFWADQVEKGSDEGNFFMNDLFLKSDIRDAVRRELDARGYRLEPNNPDLIINFRVFAQKARLRGNLGYGSTFWGQDEFDPTQGVKTGEVEPGTLILCMVDRDRNVLVWESRASGLTEAGAFLKDEGKIREAVTLMFENYNVPVEEYTRR